MQRSDKTAFFTVIIPVYNVRRYLKECVDSILAQTISDFDLILVDDGSDDGSGAICDEYCGKYDNVSTVHKANGGQSSARNTGVDRASGEYFIFVDSDDYIAHNALEMFKETIDRLDRPDVILSERMFNVEPDGRTVDRQRRLNITDFEGIRGTEAVKKMGMEWSPCGKCFRTAYWKNKGFRFIEGIISEDLQLMDRVTLEAASVAMIPAHYYYRWKIESSTMHANYGKLTKDTMFVIADWEDYLEEKKFDVELENSIHATLANMLEHTVMGNIFYADAGLIGGLVEEAGRLSPILRYDKGAEGWLIRMAISVIGVRNTCFLLNKIKTSRKRKEQFV